MLIPFHDPIAPDCTPAAEPETQTSRAGALAALALLALAVCLLRRVLRRS